MKDRKTKWTEHDVNGVLINPFYAVTLHPDLFGAHEALVSKDDWIKANARLIELYGPTVYLHRLLDTLEGDFPRSPEDGVRVDDHD